MKTQISSKGFAICKAVVAILVWLSLVFRSRWLMAIVFVILLLNAILGIRRAPLIALSNMIFRSQDKTSVDIESMRFIHTLGAIFSGITLVLLFVIPVVGWMVTLIFAIMKTVAASGMCPAEKLYSCATGSGCCMMKKKC